MSSVYNLKSAFFRLSNNRESDSDSSGGDELKELVLVEFERRGRKKKCESVDIVPSKWLDFDNTRKRCITKFLQSPYEPEDIEMLHTLVKKKADAPEDWSVFPVQVRGRARTYERAMKKSGTLEKGGNAFTTDDESASEIKSRIHNAVRQRQLKAQEKLLREMFLPVKKATQKNDEASNSESSHDIEKQVNFAVPSTSGIPSSSTNAYKIQQPKEATVPGDVVDANEHNGDAVELEVNHDDSENQVVHVEEMHDPIPNFIQQMNIPIVQLQNYESKSDFETSVLNKLDHICTRLDNISITLKDVQKKQDDTDTFLMDKRVVQQQKSQVDFLKKYELQLPIGDMETFKTCDASLSENKYLKADVYMELTLLVDDLVCITKSFSAMMKKFIAKRVAVQFTAARQARDPTKVQGAAKFKDTISMYECCNG